VAVLTGAQGDVDRRLLVLWNDGKGGLSADAVTVVSSKDDSPRAFAALPATAMQPFRLAYVTRDAATVVDGSKDGASSALRASSWISKTAPASPRPT